MHLFPVNSIRELHKQYKQTKDNSLLKKNARYSAVSSIYSTEQFFKKIQETEQFLRKKFHKLNENGISIQEKYGFRVLAIEHKFQVHFENKVDHSEAKEYIVPLWVEVGVLFKAENTEDNLMNVIALVRQAEIINYQQEKIQNKLNNIIADISHVEADVFNKIRHKVELILSSGCDYDHLLNKLANLHKVLEAETKHFQLVNEAEKLTGIHNYEEYFQVASVIKRKFILYVGPTNSGKTYSAFQRLLNAGSGAYLAPLRLMALEGQETIQENGFSCTLITGEERNIIDGAKYVSSTIEMADFTKVIPAVIIDEGQILSDADRGWAWTAALVGMPAKEVILTGSADMIPYVEHIAQHLGCEVEIHNFERKTPLEIKDKIIEIEDLKKGDAVVVFSRKEALLLRNLFQKEKLKTSIIYGNLAPEVRKNEASKFKKGETDVLIATDAIGMGLNLPIERIIFWKMTKFDGTIERVLTPQETRQIAGRAGRFGHYDKGYVTAFDYTTLEEIKVQYHEPVVLPQDKRLWVSPSFEHIQALSQALNTEKLEDLLEFFSNNLLQSNPQFKSSLLTSNVELSKILDRLPLTLREKFTYSCTPLDVYNEIVMDNFQQWLKAHVAKESIVLPELPNIFLDIPDNDMILLEAEIWVKIYSAYMWLSFRFKNIYTDTETCLFNKQVLNKFIEKGLERKALPSLCTGCRCKLPLGYKFKMCQSCFMKQRKNRH